MKRYRNTNEQLFSQQVAIQLHERDFMNSFKHDNHADVIEVFNSTSRYLDDLLNIYNPYFEGIVNQNYPPGLQFVTEPYVP